MAGIPEGDHHPRGNLLRGLVGQALEACERCGHILLPVEGLKELLVLARAPLVDVLDVALLEVGRVHEHDLAQVPRGRGGVDRPAEAFSDQRGKVPAVVDVRVAQHAHVD